MALAPRAVEEVKVETSVKCVIPWTEVQLQNVLASGAMGRIFRASLLSSFKAGGYVLRRLNVPVLNLHSHTEWVQHVSDLHKLEHPNVLQVLSLATDGMRNYGTLMPHLGFDLAHLLLRGHLTEVATKLRVVWVNLAADAAAGLAYLHSHGVAHRSLHPRNVLLDSMMAVKLTDYGRSPETLVHILESKSDGDDVVRRRWLSRARTADSTWLQSCYGSTRSTRKRISGRLVAWWSVWRR